jgi:hypothetical protein
VSAQLVIQEITNVVEVTATGPATFPPGTLANGGGSIVIDQDGFISVLPNSDAGAGIALQGSVVVGSNGSNPGSLDVTGALSVRDSRLAVVNSFVLMTTCGEPPADSEGPVFWYDQDRTRSRSSGLMER